MSSLTNRLVPALFTVTWHTFLGGLLGHVVLCQYVRPTFGISLLIKVKVKRQWTLRHRPADTRLAITKKVLKIETRELGDLVN